MKNFEGTLVVPLLLYYLFFLLDAYKTRKGISPDARNEANPFLRYLYRHFSRRAITVFDIALALLVALVAFSLPVFGGLWMLYGFAFGHFLGFLSWTKLNVFRERLKGKTFLFFFIAFVAAGVGYVLGTIHYNFLLG